MKNKTYIFEVPCSYLYKIEAVDELDARKKLKEDGGLDLVGDITDPDYEQAELIERKK